MATPFIAPAYATAQADTFGSALEELATTGRTGTHAAPTRGRSGRWLRRTLAVGAMALMLTGAMADHVDARGSLANMYVNGCRYSGGSASATYFSMTDTFIIGCTYADGSTDYYFVGGDE